MVAARTLPAGVVVARDDVRVELRAAAQRPGSAAGTVESVVGRTTATGIAARDIVTPERLIGPDLLVGQDPRRLAMTIPVLGVGLVGVRAGSRVDVFATGTGSSVASDILVLAVAGSAGGGAAGAGGASNGAAGATLDGSAPMAVSFGEEPPPAVTLSLDPQGAASVAEHLSALAAGESFVLAVHGRP